MLIQVHPVYQMFQGNGEQNPREMRILESVDRTAVQIEGVFVDDGVLKSPRRRKANVPFRVVISQPLDNWEWQFVNSRVCQALKRGDLVIELDLTFPLFEPTLVEPIR